MATVIETTLKALIDNTAWSVGAQTITKTTYIWAESHATNKDLDRPIVATTATVIVLKPSTRSELNKSLGAVTYQFIGVMELYATSATFLKKMMELLKTIVDAKQDLTVFFPGVNGDPHREYFWAMVPYRWNIFESD